MFLEYIWLFKFFLFSLALSILLFSLSFFLVFQNPDFEKVSTYECGFNPWGDSRSKFEVRFYLVGILFIIFDLEISFLFPWVVSLNDLSVGAFYMMLLFILILTLGFVYEWLKGALDWE
jgi:NADH:ubiquinone oxidoreductase subunit 3 (subunit A)